MTAGHSKFESIMNFIARHRISSLQSRSVTALLLALLAHFLTGCAGRGPSSVPVSLKSSLTLHASFDNGLDAEFAKGNPTLRHAPSMKERAKAIAGLPPAGEVMLAGGEGITGNALRFVRKESPVVYFEALRNVAWNATNWSGTVSFWLRLDPETELEPGFTDPIQITPHAWNDAAFFVEFGKDEQPRHFRLGAYADFKVWNPANREWDQIPFEEKPLVGVTRPPFSRDRWTHVAFAWENFNTGRADGVVRLYLNGELQGALSPRVQTFTWEPAQSLVMLGLSYIGLWDELAIFDRALTEVEIRLLKEKPGILNTR